MILRHEVIHIKRRDILYKTVILFARAAHWFNPLVHIMSVEANKDIELSCDAAVVENQNVDYRKDYSEAILMSVYKGNRRKTVFSTYFGGGKKMLKKDLQVYLICVKRKRYNFTNTCCFTYRYNGIMYKLQQNGSCRR